MGGINVKVGSLRPSFSKDCVLEPGDDDIQ